MKPYYFAATKIGIGRDIVAATTFRRRAILLAGNDRCRRNYSTLRRRKLESDAASLRQRLLQAGRSTCRHDGAAVILDFRPRLGNRCNNVVHSVDFRAAIPDFRSRIGNRYSHGHISGISVQRFPISGPDLAIAAAMEHISGTSVQ